MRPVAKKTHTEHERVQFLGTTEHDRGLTRTPHGENTHTERERVQFRLSLNTRGCLTRTPHGALKDTKARTRTEKTLYTKPRCIIIHLMQMSDSVPFGVMFY